MIENPHHVIFIERLQPCCYVKRNKNNNRDDVWEYEMTKKVGHMQ